MDFMPIEIQSLDLHLFFFYSVSLFSIVLLVAV